MALVAVAPADRSGHWMHECRCVFPSHSLQLAVPVGSVSSVMLRTLFCALKYLTVVQMAANPPPFLLPPGGGVIRASELEPLFPILVQSPAWTSSGPGFANLTSCSAALPGTSDVHRRGCSGMSGREWEATGVHVAGGGVSVYTRKPQPHSDVSGQRRPVPGERRTAGLRSCCVPAMLCAANNSPHVSEMGAWPRPGPPWRRTAHRWRTPAGASSLEPTCLRAGCQAGGCGAGGTSRSSPSSFWCR